MDPRRVTETAPPFRLVEGRTAFRGEPVPYTQMWVDGRPDFKVIDARKVEKCLAKRLCAICGQALGKEVAFIGGHRATAYRDPPMHERCARFAAERCPFLTGERERRDQPEDDVYASGVSRMVLTISEGYGWKRPRGAARPGDLASWPLGVVSREEIG